MPKFTRMIMLSEDEQQFAREQAAVAWNEMQDKFVGVALAPAILKIIEQVISMGMLRIKSHARPKSPTIVCLCGSTRFWRTFQEASLQETLAGKIVLSIGAARSADGDDKSFGGYMPVGEFDQVKKMLDELHLRKIDLADEVLILNVGGYIGESTRRELEYAKTHGKRVRFLEPIQAE